MSMVETGTTSCRRSDMAPPSIKALTAARARETRLFIVPTAQPQTAAAAL